MSPSSPVWMARTPSLAWPMQRYANVIPRRTRHACFQQVKITCTAGGAKGSVSYHRRKKCEKQPERTRHRPCFIQHLSPTPVHRTALDVGIFEELRLNTGPPIALRGLRLCYLCLGVSGATVVSGSCACPSHLWISRVLTSSSSLGISSSHRLIHKFCL